MRQCRTSPSWSDRRFGGAGVDVWAYIASPTADEHPIVISVTVVKISLVAFLLPFVYSSGLLLIGGWETALFD